MPAREKPRNLFEVRITEIRNINPVWSEAGSRCSATTLYTVHVFQGKYDEHIHMYM